MPKILIYSRTPLAAAPWELYKCLKKYTDLDVSLVNKRYRYADGRQFPYHYLLGSNNKEIATLIRNADLWHIHNYWDNELNKLRKGQKILAQFHSLPKQLNWAELMANADMCYTIKQPLHEKEYRLPGLPNLIDPDEYRPILRPKKPIKIAFAPSSKAPVGSFQSKGYVEVGRVLRKIKELRPVEVIWIEGKGYQTNLEMKSRAHILIDDVVTGNWHRTSLEGCCFGCAVLNKREHVPFVYADLKTLEERLLWLIDNPPILRDFQERARLWVLQNRHPIEGVQVYLDVYRRLLNG